MCFGGNGDAGGGGGGQADPTGYSHAMSEFSGPSSPAGPNGGGGNYGILGLTPHGPNALDVPSSAAGDFMGISEPGSAIGLNILSKLAPIVGVIGSVFTANPAPFAIGTGVGKALSSMARGQAVDEAIGKGALTGIGTAVNPFLGTLASWVPDQPGTGQAQPSDLAAPGMFGSVSGVPGPGGEGMAVPGQQPAQAVMPTMGPEPIASLPTGPISASNLTVPPTKANPLNLSNLLASRGIRGAGRVAPKKEWFERRT